MKKGWLRAGMIVGALLALGALGGFIQVWRIAHWPVDDTDMREYFRSFMLTASAYCAVQLLGGVFLLWRSGRALRHQAPVSA